MLQTTTFTSLDKVTVQRLMYIIAFALYCFLRNGLVTPAIGISVESLPWAINALDIITFGVIIGYVVTTVRRNDFSPAHWGIQLRPIDWLCMGVIGASGIYFVIVADGLSPAYLIGGLLLVLQVTVYELVFRAALMNLLLNKWGHSLKSVILAVLISALFYNIALLPLASFSGITSGILLVLCCLFYYARSIVWFVFLMAAFAVPNEYGFWVALFSILIYLGLTIAMSHIKAGHNREIK